MLRTCKRDLLILRRKQVPMNQMEIAAQLGISQAQYSNIENGYVTPNKAIAKKITEMLGLDSDYLCECAKGSEIGGILENGTIDSLNPLLNGDSLADSVIGCCFGLILDEITRDLENNALIVVFKEVCLNHNGEIFAIHEGIKPDLWGNIAAHSEFIHSVCDAFARCYNFYEGRINNSHDAPFFGVLEESVHVFLYELDQSAERESLKRVRGYHVIHLCVARYRSVENNVGLTFDFYDLRLILLAVERLPKIDKVFNGIPSEVFSAIHMFLLISLR